MSDQTQKPQRSRQEIDAQNATQNNASAAPTARYVGQDIGKMSKDVGMSDSTHATMSNMNKNVPSDVLELAQELVPIIRFCAITQQAQQKEQKKFYNNLNSSYMQSMQNKHLTFTYDTYPKAVTVIYGGEKHTYTQFAQMINLLRKYHDNEDPSKAKAARKESDDKMYNKEGNGFTRFGNAFVNRVTGTIQALGDKFGGLQSKDSSDYNFSNYLYYLFKNAEGDNTFVFDGDTGLPMSGTLSTMSAAKGNNVPYMFVRDALNKRGNQGRDFENKLLSLQKNIIGRHKSGNGIADNVVKADVADVNEAFTLYANYSNDYMLEKDTPEASSVTDYILNYIKGYSGTPDYAEKFIYFGVGGPQGTSNYGGKDRVAPWIQKSYDQKTIQMICQDISRRITEK